MVTTNLPVRVRAVGRWHGVAVAVAAISLALSAAGCPKNPFPAALTPQSCPGNPCGVMACPNGFVCSVDGQCGAHCQAMPVGNRAF